MQLVANIKKWPCGSNNHKSNFKKIKNQLNITSGIPHHCLQNLESHLQPILYPQPTLPCLLIFQFQFRSQRRLVKLHVHAAFFTRSSPIFFPNLDDPSKSTQNHRKQSTPKIHITINHTHSINLFLISPLYEIQFISLANWERMEREREKREDRKTERKGWERVRKDGESKNRIFANSRHALSIES